ncbi:uncharacterized protein LOC131155084 [Malania oleifera]|uniref:uncharacterized protein LOC131155084 n=1 Tax=Malania oleifera TaxID=397392 RepID=UPI0025AEB922|nr:uncharacterized protein LOC131155084 [Malania oleifera]
MQFGSPGHYKEETAAAIDLTGLIEDHFHCRGRCCHHHHHNHLMSEESSSSHISSQGRNIGAAMIFRRGSGSGSSGESQEDYCSINIYINNNTQGVTNSVLLGSEVKMRDPGVCFSAGDFMLDKGSLDTCLERMNKINSLGLKLCFCGMFLLFAFLCVLLLLLSWY